MKLTSTNQMFSTNVTKFYKVDKQKSVFCPLKFSKMWFVSVSSVFEKPHSSLAQFCENLGEVQAARDLNRVDHG